MVWDKEWGSPPPMRGKVAISAFRTTLPGITPAYAGKSPKERIAEIFQRDHPRLCGEKIFSSFSHAPQTGSPPPMRGKGQLLNHFLTDCRITPAYAGKRYSRTGNLPADRDHPRLCGEKPTIAKNFLTL